jgi:hypothetical protein
MEHGSKAVSKSDMLSSDLKDCSEHDAMEIRDREDATDWLSSRSGTANGIKDISDGERES